MAEGTLYHRAALLAIFMSCITVVVLVTVIPVMYIQISGAEKRVADRMIIFRRESQETYKEITMLPR